MELEADTADAFDKDKLIGSSERKPSSDVSKAYLDDNNFNANFHEFGENSSYDQEDNSDEAYEKSRVQLLEEEQESLLSSLMALTTHFAQVQFRLHQISEAPEKERDVLLKKLEDFADRGVPNWNEHSAEIEAKNILTKMDRQKSHQYELIEQLKNQLDDLEKYAYDSGEPILPQAIMVEKQKIILEELKQKMNLNFAFNELDLPQLSENELKTHVDSAFGEFLSPLKMQFELITQLKTQVNDLERFVKFLQVDENDKRKVLKMQFLKKQNCSEKDLHNKSCDCNYEESGSSSLSAIAAGSSSSFGRSRISPQIPSQQMTISEKFNQMLNKASTIFQIFAVSQMGCSSQNGRFKKNTLKKTMPAPHWGDIRAKLEVDIQEILSLVIQINKLADNEDLMMKMREKEAETEDDEVFISAKTKINSKEQKPGRHRDRYSSSSSISVPANSLILSSKSDELKSLNIELITLVRKKFAITLQKLIQHGLRSTKESKNLVPFMGCFANFQFDNDSPESDTEMHAWELITEYYRLKNGDSVTNSAAQLLSQSFNLDIVSEGTISNKQTLLLAIRNITNLHSPYKRSYNSHFKAFVCAGLNSHKLKDWLNLIFQSHELITKYYSTWSYVSVTGFRDALKSIDQLTKYEFYDLPVDLAIRNLANIKDVFS